LPVVLKTLAGKQRGFTSVRGSLSVAASLRYFSTARLSLRFLSVRSREEIPGNVLRIVSQIAPERQLLFIQSVPPYLENLDRQREGAVAELVGIEGGVVSGVINLESSGVEASDWRPRHDEQYHEA
jgi:hypothetical protein